MRVEFINQFIDAGASIINEMIGGESELGQLSARSMMFTTQPISILIGVSHQLEGYVLYGVSQVTAMKIASALLGEPTMQMNEMVISTLNEFGNIISGHASMRLAEQGFLCELSPPIMLRGINVEVASTIPALLIPLHTPCGQLDITVALVEQKASTKQ